MCLWLPLLLVLGLILLYRWYRQSLILENLTDKYVLITGCDTGFGNLLAKQLDKRGMKVLAACLTTQGAENLKRETSSRLHTVIMDVAVSESVKSVAKWVAEIVGDAGLWGLVNNAGIGTGFAPNLWQTKEDFVKMLNVNLLGFIDVTLNLAPLVVKARGRIINVSSSLGRLSIVGGGYCPSKYGVEAFSDSLRRELRGFGVKVCIIVPGGYKTLILDKERHMKDVQHLWQKLPENIKELFGEEYYQYCVKGLLSLIDKSNPKIYKVADCMEHALTAVHPWTRYSSGWDSKLYYLPMSYLPTAISDYLICRSSPKPAQRAKDQTCIMWLSLLVVLGLILLYRWYRQSQILENLSNKYVFITGCDSGFGNLLAKQLDKRGMKVLAACLTETGAENLKTETSTRLQTRILDITDNKSVSFAAEWVSTIVGKEGLWGLVNNAGYGIGFGPNEWQTKEDFSKFLNVNLFGTIDVTVNLLHLVRKVQGRIVLVSSALGRLSAVGGGYCPSKYGVEAFADSLRREMHAFGVKVAVVEPGAYKTPMSSFELHRENLIRLWEKLPAHIKESYGEDYYKQYMKALEALNHITSPRPYEVSDCMEHALTAVHPWTRYSPGLDCKLYFLPMSYLPTAISDYLICWSAPKVAQSISPSAEKCTGHSVTS
ncbi:uncharacterized protein ACMZJ9_001096 [Mantella aurantiaca]